MLQKSLGTIVWIQIFSYGQKKPTHLSDSFAISQHAPSTSPFLHSHRWHFPTLLAPLHWSHHFSWFRFWCFGFRRVQEVTLKSHLDIPFFLCCIWISSLHLNHLWLSSLRLSYLVRCQEIPPLNGILLQKLIKHSSFPLAVDFLGPWKLQKKKYTPKV